MAILFPFPSCKAQVKAMSSANWAELKVESEKVGLKLKNEENEDHGIRSHRFMGNRWVNSENSVRLYFSGLQNHCRW